MNGNLLMRTPRPFDDESPRGFLVRLTEVNGYDRLTVIQELLGNKPHVRPTVGWDYRRCAELIGEGRFPPGFGYGTRRPTRKRHFVATLAGHSIRSTSLDLTYARVCPQCLAESSYIRMLWDFRLVVSCPTHGCHLLLRCPSCERKIKCHRARVAFCSCGYDFRNYRSALAPSGTIAIAELIETKLFESATGPIVARSIGFPVGDLLRLDLIVMLEVFTAFASVHVRLRSDKRRRSVSELQAGIDRAASALQSWPHGFHRLCSDWMKFAEHRPIKQLCFHAVFKWLFEGLYKNFRKERSQTRFILKEAYSFGLRNWERPIVVRQADIQLSELPPPRFVSMTHVASKLGHSPETLRRAILAGELPAERMGSGSKTPWSIDPRDLPQPVRAQRRMRMQEAPRELGLTQSLYKAIRYDGHIVRPSSSLAVRRYSAHDVSDLLEQLSEVVRPFEQLHNYFSFDDFLRSNVTVSRKKEVVRLILAGDIEVFGEMRCTFRDLMTKRDLVAENLPVRDGLCAWSAARELGLHPTELQALYPLISHGRPPSQSVVVFRRSAIRDFKSKYVVLRHAARDAGLAPHSLLWAMRSTNPHLLVSLTVKRKGRADFIVTIVRRSDMRCVRRLIKEMLARPALRHRFRCFCSPGVRDQWKIPSDGFLAAGAARR